MQQEREAETLIAALLGIFEPMLILVMGGVVLIIVLAILLPILTSISWCIEEGKNPVRFGRSVELCCAASEI